MKTAKAKLFFQKNRGRFIKTWTDADVMAMADDLLQDKCISSPTYKEIRQAKEKARSLYDAMETNDMSYRVCYEYMKEHQPFLMKDLEKKKKKTGDVTASEPLEKKARIEEPDQTQVQDATNETDSASTPNFTGWTLSKLLEHVEDPVKIKHLVTSLEQRLEDGEMEKLESELQNCALKNTVSFNHEAFREICINGELSNFFKSKGQEKFPKKTINRFFTGGLKKGRPEPLRIQDEPEKYNGDQNSTYCHSKGETNSIRMQKSLTVSSDIGYTSTQKSVSIHDPPQEAQRAFKTSIRTLTPPLECQQSISGEAVAEDGATTSEVTSAATEISADTTSSPTADAASAVIPERAFSVAVAANGGQTNNGNPRKQQNKKVFKKTTEEMWRNNRNILHKYLKIKQIPSTSGTVLETEELKKIKDCIRTVDCREHPSYPLLLADHCIVFHEENQKKIIEILDSAAFKKNGQLKEEFRFKVQFHMWLLDISKTVVLSKKEDPPYVEIQADSFEAEEKRFQQYLHKVVIPLFAVYKKVQREREL
ncbi:uncharacterized protein LOC118229036 isoform X4 [Anguilla anguilla]|uniref:uncharacterized protein LOC118229036 isoform X4 n=1 Tax=Anguilla anguilla TaxID=7936 RepID=UPI0015AE2400|nr:uncharacterized protein LOC118229036 isoform X4 [Anguilla anguilla]